MKRKNTYHVGFAKRGKTMIIEAKRQKDELSPELYDYMGERITTKVQLKKNGRKILNIMKERKPKVYGNLTRVSVR